MDYFVLRFDHSYRKEDFRALSGLADKTTRKWSGRVISLFGFVVGLFAFLSGILMLRSDEGMSELTATLLLFGGLCLVLCFFRSRLNAWGARKQALKVENLTMKFSDEGLTQSSDKATATVPYSAFERLRRSGYARRQRLTVPRAHQGSGDGQHPAYRLARQYRDRDIYRRAHQGTAGDRL